MKTADRYLNDEHMQMYEWSGLGADLSDTRPAAGAKRTHAWPASYGVLAALTTLLILNGCDTQSAAEQAGEHVGQTTQDRTAEPHPMDGSAPDAAAPELAPTDPAPPVTDGVESPPVMDDIESPPGVDAGQP